MCIFIFIYEFILLYYEQIFNEYFVLADLHIGLYFFLLLRVHIVIAS